MIFIRILRMTCIFLYISVTKFDNHDFVPKDKTVLRFQLFSDDSILYYFTDNHWLFWSIFHYNQRDEHIQFHATGGLCFRCNGLFDGRFGATKERIYVYHFIYSATC